MAGPPIVEIREPGREVRRRVLADQCVSRRHLRLVPSPVALSVIDLGSRNGTKVNGVRITGRVVLEPGAVVRLGSSEIVMVGRAERAMPTGARTTVRPGHAD
jgi:nitrite reductase (NADH) large subunit